MTTGPVTTRAPAAVRGEFAEVIAAISATDSGITQVRPVAPAEGGVAGQGGGRDHRVVERQHGPADVLAGLVSLACHEHHVPLPRQAGGKLDRRGPVRLDDHPAPLPLRDPEHSLQHLGEDGERVLRARVVAREDRHVREPGRGGAHQRALAAVAVAAAAEHHDQFPARHRAKRAEHRLDRARLVRVVDERVRPGHRETPLPAAGGRARRGRRPRLRPRPPGRCPPRQAPRWPPARWPR